jgi:Single-strand binding protein family
LGQITSVDAILKFAKVQANGILSPSSYFDAWIVFSIIRYLALPSANCDKAAARFGSSSPHFCVSQNNGVEKGDIFMSYLMNSVTIVGFVGADPEQRQARNNGSKFTVLSVATQRSWRNDEDEWVSKVEWHRVAIIWN